jgi:hypothetical protein
MGGPYVLSLFLSASLRLRGFELPVLGLLDRDNSYIGNVHTGESEATAIDLTESETQVGVIVFC